MKLSLWSACLLSVCLLSASAAASDAKLALDGLDPMELIQGQTTKGQPRYSAEQGDFKYWFKSEENRAKFASDPERYGLQLGGNCVLGDTMPGSQKLHAVVDGRIYLGASEHCIERFKESPATFVDVKTGKRLAMRADSPAEDDRPKVAILIFEGVQIIDYTGPWEVFGQAGFNVYTVAEKPGTLTTAMGMKVTPNYTFENAPIPDVLVTPGGNVDTGNVAVVEWVKAVAPKSRQVMSVCNGAFWLAKAGLLEGQSATTFHAVIDALRESAPNTKVVSDKRYVDNGKVITTAGLTSGIDGALYLVSKMQGFGSAQAVALRMEYNWDPKSTYARAALADKPIRFLRWPFPREKAKGIRLLKQDGDTHWWKKSWEVEGGGAPEVLKWVAESLADRWTSAGSSRGESHWTMADGDGTRWKATVQVAPEKSSDKLEVSILVNRTPAPTHAL